MLNHLKAGNKFINTMNTKIVVLFLFIFAALFSGYFYWTEIRPARIKHDCSWVKGHSDAVPAVIGMTEEEKQEAIKRTQACEAQGRRFCLEFHDNWDSKPAIPAKDWWQPARPKEYDFCLHEKGL